ncbi:MAG: SMC-Scp complex subunit ScpB [Planctomycetota bacterium]
MTDVIDATSTIDQDTATEELPSPGNNGEFDVPPESIVEALLFSSDSPLSASILASILGKCSVTEAKLHVDALNDRYKQHGFSFRIMPIAKGYQMLTLPRYNEWLAKLHKNREDSRLSTAAMETLAIVAYKQPVLRAQVESIRGVAVGDMLVRLRDANLVRIVGRAEEVGRPLLYGTTTKFLEVFGLRSVDDLPQVDDKTPDQFPPLRIATPPTNADSMDKSDT